MKIIKMHFNFENSSIRGFSLVELSVVLTIIGITLSGAMDLATTKTEAERVKETNIRMDTIEQALQLFVIKNQRLPCPSDPSATQSSAGSEVPPTAGGCSNSSNLFISGNVYAGMVPTKTLGLDDKYMADDWNRRFTYAVDKRFANNALTATCSSNTGSQMCFKNTTIPQSTDINSIIVNDSSSNNANNRTNQAIYVLISHGKNGYGAWKYTGGSQLPSSTDPDEISNAATSSATLDATFVQADTNNNFDDILRYSTKALVIDNINGETDTTTCYAATDSVPQTGSGTDPCQGASNQANCYALASQIYNFCMQP